MTKKLPFVSILIVNFNGKKFLGECFHSLSLIKYPENCYEILMVDNGSTDGSCEFVQSEYSQVKIIHSPQNNFSFVNNMGIRKAKGELIAFLNNDTRVEEGWLMGLVESIQRDPAIAASGSKILFMDGRIQSTGHEELPNFYWQDRGAAQLDENQFDQEEEVPSLSGCSVLFRKDALTEVGGLDEDLHFYLEDVDLFLRLQEKGWKLHYTPKSVVRHYHHGTSKEEQAKVHSERNRLLLIAKHFPEKLSNALLGEGFFTGIRDVKAQGALFDLLDAIVLKVTKHHKREDAQVVLKELFSEVKKIGTLESSILMRKFTELERVSREQKDTIFQLERALKIKSPKEERVNRQKISICTIISKNYLAYARILAESFSKHNEGDVFVLLTDKVDEYFDPGKEPFILIELEELQGRINEFEQFCFQYDPTELNTAVKPFFLEYLFEKNELEKLIFLDPDILITHSLGKLSRLLEQHSIILTPHITQPFSDLKKPSELEILNSGVYNLGFIGLANTPTTRELLKWWKERLLRFCKLDFNKGLFVDQKWIDLIPGFFKDICILRDETFNVAYWNFHYRKLQVDDEGEIFVNGKPLHFLHFSGLETDRIDAISKHQNRFTSHDLKPLRKILKRYKKLLEEKGYLESSKWPCFYNYFDNGAFIPASGRLIYWQMNDQQRKKFKNPFIASKGSSFFSWLNGCIDHSQPPITRMMYELYKERGDVQIIYPDIFFKDREGFINWFLTTGFKEHKIDLKFLKEVCPQSREGKRSSLRQLGSFVYLRSRGLLKSVFKRIFSNNLSAINRLKMLERRIFTQKVVFPAHSSGGKGDTFETDQKEGVNLVGYLTAELGVGEAARTNARCLEAAGLPFALHNVTTHSVSRQEDTSFSNFLEHNPYSVNLIHMNADMLPLFCAEKGTPFFQNKYNIGYWAWELSEFPDEWLDSFRYCQEIWVPSNFVYSSVTRKSPIPVFKIPHAIRVDNIKDISREYFGLKNDEYVFLFIFDFLSYFERKNPLAVIEAFRMAFSEEGRVRLVIKCTNSEYNQFGLRQLTEWMRKGRIDIIDKHFDRDEVNALIALSDCYVSLHRSEGFGLTLAEAMYLEKPVIATRYSGNTDFMNEENSYLVDYKLDSIQTDTGPYRKGCVWASPDVEHAARLMRHIYLNQKEAKDKGKKAREDIVKNLSEDEVGSQIRKRIESIVNEQRLQIQ